MLFVIQIVIFIFSAGVGVIFNAYILLVLWWNRKIPAANNLLLLHMALVNIVFCLMIFSCISFVGSSSEEIATPLDSNKTDKADSKALGFLWSFLPVVMIWSVGGLSCDRYAAISTPLHYARIINSKRVLVFLGFAWCVALVLSMPPLFGVCAFMFRPYRWNCAIICANKSFGEMAYMIIYFGMALVAPIVIILCSNVHILLIARYHRHRIVTAIYEITLRAQATVTHQQNTNYLSKYKGRSAFLTITQLAGSVMLLNIPYFSALLWDSLSESRYKDFERYLVIPTLLLSVSAPFNAYVYGVKSKILRQTLKMLLQRHFYKKEASKEVRKRLSAAASNRKGLSLQNRCRSLPPEEFRQRTPIFNNSSNVASITRTFSLPILMPMYISDAESITDDKLSVGFLKSSLSFTHSISESRRISKSLNDLMTTDFRNCSSQITHLDLLAVPLVSKVKKFSSYKEFYTVSTRSNIGRFTTSFSFVCASSSKNSPAAITNSLYVSDSSITSASKSSKAGVSTASTPEAKCFEDGDLYSNGVIVSTPQPSQFILSTRV